MLQLTYELRPKWFSKRAKMPFLGRTLGRGPTNKMEIFNGIFHDGGGRGSRVQWTKIENLFMMIYFKLSRMFPSLMSSKSRLSYQLQIIRNQQ